MNERYQKAAAMTSDIVVTHKKRHNSSDYVLCRSFLQLGLLLAFLTAFWILTKSYFPTIASTRSSPLPQTSIYRSTGSFPGVISGIGKCSPLSLTILGHAKAGTSDLYTLIIQKSRGIFIEPRRKEVGCFGGYMSPQRCIDDINGPATCHWNGKVYSNLTIDAAPLPMKFNKVRWSNLTEFYFYGFSPASIVILREPVSTMESLYNHWMWPNLVSETVCSECSLEKLVLAELAWLHQESTKSSIERILSALENGYATRITLEVDRDILIQDFLSMYVPPECRRDDSVGESFQHNYLLDGIYELSLLPFSELMTSGRFLMVDFNLYSKQPDTVRDSIYEMLFGSDLYMKLQEEAYFASWRSHEVVNEKSEKRKCALLTAETKCQIAKYLEYYSERFFEILENLAQKGAISTLSLNSGKWWDSVQLYC